MNRRQRRAVWWLYRTLLRRRWHRLGPGMKSLGAFLVAVAAVVAGGAFLLAMVLGIVLLPNASPFAVLLVWDGVLAGFLFFRLAGIATDLRTNDSLSMQNLLHLPLVPSHVFLLNAVALQIQPAALIFGAAIVGLSLASMFALGIGHALVVLLAVAALWCTIVLTHQLQTYLAALMVNKRLRGTIAAVSFLAFMLLVNGPNIYLQIDFWSERGGSESVGVTEEAQEVEEPAEAARDPGGLPRWALVTNLAVPPGWLAYGAYEAKQGRYWPAAVGTLGLLAVTGWSLRRSYRSAMRVYRRRERRRGARTNVKGSAGIAQRVRRSRRVADAYWRLFPALPAAIGRASMRQWFRSPQGKYALFSPIFVVMLTGLLAFRFDMSAGQPYAGLGLAAFASFTGVVFANNLFGWDRGGFRVLLAADPPRHLVLLGKNLGLVPPALTVGVLALVCVQLAWPQPIAHLVATFMQFIVFCLVFFRIGTHASITAPWAASFVSQKPPSEATAANVGTFFAALFCVLLQMLVVAGLLAIEHLVTDALAPVPVYLMFSALELWLAAAWFRRTLLRQADALSREEEHILEVINTPVD